MSRKASSRKDSPLTRRETFSHWSKEQVRWSDTDLVGHVNNLSFATYCETGRTFFLHEIITSNVSEGTTQLVIAQMTVSFLGEVHWPAEIDIGTGVLSLGRTSFCMGHGVFVGERCVATSDSVIVSIDESSRQPCPIPQRTREYLSRFIIDMPAD